MSTFMGLAWIDLVPGADADAALAEFRETIPSLPQRPGEYALEASTVAVERADGGCRIAVWAGGEYAEIAHYVAQFAEDTGLVSHAFVALDHDEYGAEHIILDAHDGTVRRVYHYFAYPRDEDTGEHYTDGDPDSVSSRPAIEKPVATSDPGALVDGPLARATIAERYGVPVAAVDEAAAADALAYEEIGLVGGPCSRWRDALGLAWPTDEPAS